MPIPIEPDDDPAPATIARAREILAEFAYAATCTGFDTPDCPCRELALRVSRMEQMTATNAKIASGDDNLDHL